jgi:hypothetical protein
MGRQVGRARTENDRERRVDDAGTSAGTPTTNKKRTKKKAKGALDEEGYL